MSIDKLNYERAYTMIQIQNNTKTVHYVTYEYHDMEEKERHIVEMASDDYECLDRFEDADKVTYRKFIHE
ncbi:MAG: hypothetical protein H7X94_03560 [Vallitaleaceae bacterium]|nr:hypothetical protein [Vallitaleaceae bacterium]